jgi:Mechanosensitive ion channel, conserved TM helix
MWEQINRIFNQAATRITNGLADFLPGVVVFCLIVLVFGMLAVAARVLVLRLLRGFDFDRRASQLGLAFLGEWSVAGSPSLALARLLFWTIVIVGLLAGLTSLNATMPSQFALTIFDYMPDLLAALVIVIIGNILARFLARSVLISAVNMQIQAARLLSIGVKWLVLVLAGAMALEHLRIGRPILLLAFGILFGGIVLALALAVGLGSKEMVTRSLERQIRDAAEERDKLNHV